jgi:Zn finger protein HypA/HybF involved in hydrogenase expression
MREKSVYVLDCAQCGARIEIHEPHGKCGRCGVEFRIERGDTTKGGNPK